VATVVNCVLDALLIFGRGGFPRMGVAGAALATVISQAVGGAIFLALFLARRNRARYATASGWRFDREPFFRLLRFGLPAGLQFFLEIAAFSLFLMIVGRIGTDALAASALAFNLNMIVFMPMLGLSVAVSSLVGRYLGARLPDVAARATYSAFAMSLVFMAACGAVYVFLPRLILLPYAAGADARAFAPVGDLTVVLLRFVAFYSIFDMMNVIFAGGLKGAGDTRYPLLLTAVLSVFALLLPAYLLCVVGSGGVLAAWSAATAYVALLGPLMLKRFLGGRWRTMSLIERNPEALPAS
jgi:MATE family multidrug resistance protein